MPQDLTMVFIGYWYAQGRVQTIQKYHTEQNIPNNILP